MSRDSLIEIATREVARKSPIRRAMRIEARNGDQVIGKTKSFTQASGVEYHPSIDCQSFEHHCDCRDHECRKRVCKHLKRLALSLIRRGDLPAVFFERAGLECCYGCGATEGETEALFPMCHDDGTPMHGVSICRECVQRLNTKSPTPEEIAANDAIAPWGEWEEDFE